MDIKLNSDEINKIKSFLIEAVKEVMPLSRKIVHFVEDNTALQCTDEGASYSGGNLNLYMGQPYKKGGKKSEEFTLTGITFDIGAYDKEKKEGTYLRIDVNNYRGKWEAEWCFKQGDGLTITAPLTVGEADSLNFEDQLEEA